MKEKVDIYLNKKKEQKRDAQFSLSSQAFTSLKGRDVMET